MLKIAIYGKGGIGKSACVYSGYHTGQGRQGCPGGELKEYGEILSEEHLDEAFVGLKEAMERGA